MGGSLENPHYVKYKKSLLFSDEKSNIAGYVRVILEDKKPKKVWRITSDKKKLHFFAPSGDIYDSFKVEHISRDRIIIKSAVNRKCLQYIWRHTKFALRRCRNGRARRKQTFLITDESGVWQGRNSNTLEFKASENGVFWGLCPSCIINGFGSEIQGKLFDIENGAENSDMDRTKLEDILPKAYNKSFSSLTRSFKG